jgi:hypothetical protein
VGGFVFRDIHDLFCRSAVCFPCSRGCQNACIPLPNELLAKPSILKSTASPLGFRLSLLLLSAAFLALLLDAQLLNSSLLSLYQAFASTDIESFSVILENLFGEEDLSHSAQLLCISAQDPLKVVDLDLLAARIGCADCGAVTGFDDKVCDDFIEGCEGCG